MAELAQFALHPGDPAPPFSLPGVDGKSWSLDSFSGSRLLLVIFSCNHCPYVRAWEDRIMAIGREYAPRGVSTVLINANETEHYPEDGFEAMAARARLKHYPFPYLRDDSQEVAHAYGALVTPHPMVFGPDRRLLFQGRVDDNHDHPEFVQHKYLREALDEALAGQPIRRSEVAVLGCSVKWRS
ncbi:MAG: thioredoxin family protein [Thermoplasmata archaeon]|nr:thioredoxin family protein [Thermoplasmata archaeon]